MSVSPQSNQFFSRILKFVMLAASFAPASALAQFGPRQPQQPVKRELYIEIDDRGPIMLKRAERYIEVGDWALAVQIYDKVLNDDVFSDLLIRKKANGGSIIGLRKEVRQRLHDLPEEGKRAYRLLRRVDAKLAWEKGRKGDKNQLEKILIQYPIAGYSGPAAARLAALYFEAGQLSQAHKFSKLAIYRYKNDLKNVESDPEEFRQLNLETLRTLAYCEAIKHNTDQLSKALKLVSTSFPDQLKSIEATANKLFLLKESSNDTAHPLCKNLTWQRDFIEFFDEQEVLPANIEPTANSGKIYFHNSNFAYAIEQNTGKLLWKTALHKYAADFDQPKRLCRVAITPQAVVLTTNGTSVEAFKQSNGEKLWQIDQALLRELSDDSSPIRVCDAIITENNTVFVPLVTSGSNHNYRVLAINSESGKPKWFATAATIAGGSDGVKTRLAIKDSRLYVIPNDGIVVALNKSDGSFDWLCEYGQGGTYARTPHLLNNNGNLLLVPAESPRLVRINSEDGAILKQAALKTNPLCLGEYKNQLVLLYRNGEIRTGPGAKKVVIKLEKKIKIKQIKINGSILYLNHSNGLLSVSLKSGKLLNLTQWNKDSTLEQHIAIADQQVVVTTAGNIRSYSVEQAELPKWDPKDPNSLKPEFLLSELGHPSWSHRELASKTILNTGTSAQQWLKTGINNQDCEIRIRSQSLYQELGREAQRQVWRQRIKSDWLKVIPGLLERLTHPNSRIRLQALVRLNQVEDREVLTLMRDLLKDPNFSIALAAAKMLYLRRQRDGVKQFELALKDDSEKQALGVLATINKRKARRDRKEDYPFIQIALNHPSHKVRAAAVSLAVDLGDRKAVPDLANALNDKSPEVRIATVTGLTNLRLSRTIPALTKALKDTSSEVRSIAVKGLANFESREAAIGLCAACLDKNLTIAESAATALNQIASGPQPQVIPNENLKAAFESKHASVKNLIMRVFENRITVPLAVRVKLALATESDDPIGQLNKVYQHAGPGDIDVLEPLLESENTDTLYYVVQIFGGLETVQADPALLQLLDSKHDQISEKAASYLQRACHPRTVWLLLRRKVLSETIVKDLSAQIEKQKQILTKLKAEKALLKNRDLAAATLTTLENRLKLAKARAKRHAQIITNMNAENEAPGLILALDDPIYAVRKLAFSELKAIVRDNSRGYDPTKEDRAQGIANWQAWFFDYKTDSTHATYIKALASTNANNRLEAAKNLKFAPNPTSLKALLITLKSEKIPFVAEAIDKVLADIFLVKPKLPKSPKPTQIQAAAKGWEKLLPYLNQTPQQNPRVEIPTTPRVPTPKNEPKPQPDSRQRKS